MGAEFRQRTPGEYLGMLIRRKWMIILPVITFTLTLGIVAYRMPSIYASTTLLTVKPPTISDKVVTPLSEDDLTRRLKTIEQEVLSRSSLEPMIVKHDLYKSERESGTDMSVIVDKMRKAIIVEVEKSREEKLAAFRLTFRGQSPQSAKNVTAELAAKYVSAQTAAATETAEVTRDFIDRELGQKKAALDALDKERLEIMMRNVDALPESSQALIAQLQGLRSREDGFVKEKNALLVEKGRLNDQIGSNVRQMRLIEDYGYQDAADAGRIAGQLEDTPAYTALVQRRAELASQLDRLLKSFTEKHPDVIAKREELARVNDEIESLKKTAQRRAETANQSGVRAAELRRKNLEIENQRLQSQIAMIDRQMEALSRDLDNSSRLISDLESKINTIPSVKVALEGITTQYQAAKQSYDDLLKKSNDANLQATRTANSQGETIAIQDAANLPKVPVAPKRAVLTAFGAALGLGLGILLALAAEVPRLFSVESVEDAKYYTGLPLLASVPSLRTREEARKVVWRSRRNLILGSFAALAAVAPLALLLEATRILERMSS